MCCLDFFHACQTTIEMSLVQHIRFVTLDLPIHFFFTAPLQHNMKRFLLWYHLTSLAFSYNCGSSFPSSYEKKILIPALTKTAQHHLEESKILVTPVFDAVSHVWERERAEQFPLGVPVIDKWCTVWIDEISGVVTDPDSQFRRILVHAGSYFWYRFKYVSLKSVILSVPLLRTI